jgi:EmrB/QacA subfamily drug resistance transporter
VSLDGSALNVALPSVQRDLDATSANLQLIVVAYLIAMAACILPIGAISDRVGRKAIYITGLIGFTIGSALSAISWNVEILIVARTIQGFGGAAISGLSIAILTANADRARIPKIIAMWTTVSIVASSSGPFIGGLLVSSLGWRSVYYINVPLAILVTIITLFSLKDDHQVQDQRLKLTGAALLALTLTFFTWAMMQLQQFGLTSLKVLLPLLMTIIATVLFVRQQRRTDTPLLEWGSLKRNPIPVSLVLNLLLGLALSGSLYQMTLFNQNVLDFSPTLAGTVTLTMSLALIVLAAPAAKLMQKAGTALPVTIAMLIAAGGMLFLSQLNPSSTLTIIIIGLLILGIGLGISTPIMSAIAMQSASKSETGAVSGSLGLVSIVGSILGITVMGGLTSSVAVSKWSNGGGDPALDSLVGVGNLGEVASKAGQAARDLAANSYTSGVEATFIVGAVLLVIASLSALAFLPKKPLESDVEIQATVPMF